MLKDSIHLGVSLQRPYSKAAKLASTAGEGSGVKQLKVNKRGQSILVQRSAFTLLFRTGAAICLVIIYLYSCIQVKFSIFKIDTAYSTEIPKQFIE